MFVNYKTNTVDAIDVSSRENVHLTQTGLKSKEAMVTCHTSFNPHFSTINIKDIVCFRGQTLKYLHPSACGGVVENFTDKKLIYVGENVSNLS